MQSQVIGAVARNGCSDRSTDMGTATQMQLQVGAKVIEVGHAGLASAI